MRRTLQIVVLAMALAGCHKSADPQVTDLSEDAVDPLGDNAPATVLVFIATECPISNRYVPELIALNQKYKPRGVVFRAVYPVRSETILDVRFHHRSHAFGFEGVRDLGHSLVKRAGVTVTPEVAVFTPGRKLVYRGRIDDRQIDFGQTRAEPTTHELADALEAVLGGKPVAVATTPSIGCSIPP